MSYFICPVCKNQLGRVGSSYICPEHHNFDVSKDGYVNLLMSNQSSQKRHGDDKLMVLARRDFLQKGYYSKLCDTICDVVNRFVCSDSIVVDVGCGEGYYSKSIVDTSPCVFYGIDISKDALRYASRSIKNGEFAVASAFNLPFASQGVDCIVNIFAPSPYEEFFRVLKSDGFLIKAVPLSEHLWGLKSTIYDKPYKNKPELKNDELFELVDFTELQYEITLDNTEDILNLFKMTPYYYKTGRADAEKLFNADKLSTAVHFGVEVYRKR